MVQEIFIPVATTIGWIEADSSGEPTVYTVSVPDDGVTGSSNPLTVETRGYIDFDTSTIPEAAVITGATLEVNYVNLGGPPPTLWSTREYVGSDVIGAALTSADFGAAGFVADNNINIVAGWNTFTVTITKINKAGNTSFELRDTSASLDFGTWSAVFYGSSPTRKPKLTVSWNMPRLFNCNIRNCKIYNGGA
jgi:hypothetical protein